MTTAAQLKLLIVDDEASIRTSLSLELDEFGYRVRSAEDGYAALREISQNTPDILLSDLNMPGMSGFELLPLVRSWFPAMQIIAMSGTFSGCNVPSGVVADAFYEKGKSIDDLLQILQSMPLVKQIAPPPPGALSSAKIVYPTNNIPSSTRSPISIAGFSNLSRAKTCCRCEQQERVT